MGLIFLQHLSKDKCLACNYFWLFLNWYIRRLNKVEKNIKQEIKKGGKKERIIALEVQKWLDMLLVWAADCELGWGSSVFRIRCCKHLDQRAEYIGSPSQQSLNWCDCLLARQCVQVCWRPCINGAHLAKPVIAFSRLFYLSVCGLLQISNCYSSLFSAHTKTTKQGLCHCVRHLRTLW